MNSASSQRPTRAVTPTPTHTSPLARGIAIKLVAQYARFPLEGFQSRVDEAARLVDGELTKVRDTVVAASEHLDYCGYGDKWERGCAEGAKLPTRMAAAIMELTPTKST